MFPGSCLLIQKNENKGPHRFNQDNFILSSAIIQIKEIYTVKIDNRPHECEYSRMQIQPGVSLYGLKGNKEYSWVVP